MAAAKKKRRRKKKMTIPIAIVAGFVPGVYTLGAQLNNPREMMRQAVRIYTGYDPHPTRRDWRWQYLLDGSIPILLGLVVHSVAGALGANRMLARAGVPFLRV